MLEGNDLVVGRELMGYRRERVTIMSILCACREFIPDRSRRNFIHN
jgi:hypothetical protein